MPFTRNWDSSCPRVLDTWEANGTTWVVQDIRPEDDELAVDIYVEHFIPDEVICTNAGILNEPDSLEEIKTLWRETISQRVSIGCYKVENGEKTLVALNACVVKCLGDKALGGDADNWRGKGFKELVKLFEYTEKQTDAFKSLGVDKLLYGVGLVVKKEFRGAKLGARVVNAREPLCRLIGVNGTSTLFTGPASQKTAERCGFTTERVFSHKEFKEQGFSGYTDDETKVMKLMIKKYD